MNNSDIDFDFDQTELKKIKMNNKLYAFNKNDHFALDTVLELINTDTIPVDLPLNNNQVFIRDLTNYLVDNKLEPDIEK